MKIQTRIHQLCQLLRDQSDVEKRGVIIQYINKHYRSFFLRVKVVGSPLVSKYINDYTSTKNFAVIRNFKVLKKFLTYRISKNSSTLVIENIHDDKAFIIETLHELVAWLLIPAEIRLLYSRNKIPDWRNYLPATNIIREYELSVRTTLWKQR